MTWLTEHPTGAYLILAILGGISLLVFFASRRIAHLSGLLVAVLLAVGVFLIDRAVVTDREQVELNTKALAKAVQEGDIAKMGELLSERFQMEGHGRASLLHRAKAALIPGGVRTIQVWDLAVPRSDDPSRLECHCNASASGAFDRGTIDPPYLGTLELVYEKEGKDWRITKMTGKGMGGAKQRIP